MPRLLPFYRTGMALSGGGGGAPGDATVWPAVGDWVSLGTIAGPLRVGDRATIIDLLPGYGVAQYNGSAWELVQAVFSTVADLSGFGDPIAAGATAIVGTGIETDPMYYHDGAQWLRMPDGVPFAWVLSSTRDFSAVGLRDGDYGIYTPASGLPVLLRYVAACSAVGGGTIQAWVHPDLYGRANLACVCFVAGSETPPAYGNTLQGYQYDRTGVGTITSTGGYMQLNAPAPGSGNQFAFMTGPNISGAKRFYVQTEMRGTTAGTLGQAGLFNLSTVPQTQWAIGAQRNVSSGVVLPIFWNGSSWAAALTGTSVRDGGLALPASTPWLVEGFSSGGAITDMMVTRIDGFEYCSLRRNFDSATISTNFNFVPFAGGNVSGTSSGRLEIRNHYVFTSD